MCGSGKVEGEGIELSQFELVFFFSLQRPTAHELLRHRFLKVARKTSYMTELIDRYRRWKLENSDEDELMDDDNDGRGK